MEHIDSKTEPGTQTLASGIAAELRARITDGAIPPGEKLRLDDLRATFGVSLSPLREALSRLSAEGFVVMEDQRGYRVAPISEKNLREVTRLRVEFEAFALREAIHQGDDHWEGELVAGLYRLNKLESSASPRLPEWEAAHRAFHQKLLVASDMPLLLQFCLTLHDLSDRYRRLFLEDHPIDRNVSEEHSEIANAALQRKPDLACQLLRTHIERTGTNVLDSLKARRLNRALANL